MKCSHVAVALIALGWPASEAWAQFGLSGSPELLRLSSHSAVGQPTGYPSTSAPPAVTLDPAMRPLSSTSSAAATSSGYSSASGQVAPGPPAIGRPPSVGPPGYSPPPPATSGPQLQGPGLVGQMLEEPGCPGGSCWSGYGSRGPIAPGPACSVPAPGPTCDIFPSVYQPSFYATAAGLIMNRNEANRVWTTYQTNNNPNQLLNTQDAVTNWQGGFEVTLGAMLFCNQWAVEVTYWRLAEMNGFAEVANRDYGVDAFSYSTPLNFDSVVWANPAIPGVPTDIFDFSRQHRIWRTNTFQNLEVNLIRHQITACCPGSASIDWSVGARYFQFDERLTFGALRQNVPPEPAYAWGSNGGQCEAYLEDSIHNALIGFQFGLNAVFPLHPSFRLFVSPKFGIYNNHIEHRFSGYRGDGEVIGPDPNSGVSGTFPVSGSTDALSFMTEVNLGVDWNFAPRWNAFVGYRVLWATGIGLADNQFIPYVVDVPGHAHIEHNADLVLHGAFAGVTVCF